MKTSFKKVNITPKIGTQMGGFSERKTGCTSIHDEVDAYILTMVNNDEEKLVIVSLDLIGIDKFAVGKIREKVTKNINIKANQILINAIHTHSSSFGCRLNGIDFLGNKEINPEMNLEYYNNLIIKVADGIIESFNDLSESKVGFGIVHNTKVGTNRNNPKNYYDTDTNIFKVTDMSDNIKLIVVNHACHPTVLDHNNYAITADYVHYLRTRLSEKYHCNVMFLQGCAGSASARYVKNESSFEEAKRLGYQLADLLVDIDKFETYDDLKLSGSSIKLELPVKDMPRKEDLERQLKEYKEQYDLKEKDNVTTKQDLRRMYVTMQGLERSIRMTEKVTFDTVISEIQILHIGKFVIVGIPGDCFGEIGKDIKKLGENITVLGYTDDFIGYIVSKDGYKQDCYEKNISIFDERTHDIILKTVKEHLL